MDYKPPVGTRVKSNRGLVGTVTSHPKKEKHQDKVFLHKDGQTGCNATILVKYQNLTPLSIINI